MWKVVYVLQLNFLMGSCRVVVFPENTVAIADERMEMECVTDVLSTVREWKFQGRAIFVNWEKDLNRIANNRFNVEVNETGSGKLYINSTKITDAGTYSCIVQTGAKQPVLYNAELTVLVSEPSCHINYTTGVDTLSDGAPVRLWCEVTYKGALEPIFQWRRHLNGEVKELNATNVVAITHSEVRTMQTTLEDLAKESSLYSFNLNFSAGNNTRGYNYTWFSSLPTTPNSSYGPDLTTSETTVFKTSVSSNDQNSLTLIPMALVSVVSIVAGSAITAVIILCLRLRRMKSEANRVKDEAETRSSCDLGVSLNDIQQEQYDTLDYDTMDDIPETICLHGDVTENPVPILKSDYLGLLPPEPKSPSTYNALQPIYGRSARQRVPEGDREVLNLPPSVNSSTCDKRTACSPGNMSVKSGHEKLVASPQYLELTSGEYIPSSYLKISDDTTPSLMENTLESTYLTTVDTAAKDTDHYDGLDYDAMEDSAETNDLHGIVTEKPVTVSKSEYLGLLPSKSKSPSTYDALQPNYDKSARQRLPEGDRKALNLPSSGNSSTFENRAACSSGNIQVKSSHDKPIASPEYLELTDGEYIPSSYLKISD